MPDTTNTPAPSFETTPQQRQQLSEDGFALLPGALPSEQLAHWQALAARLEQASLGNQLHGACVVDAESGPRLVRYDDILGHDAEAVLDLLACPAMMAVAREMCGRGSVPLQLDILFKHAHPGDVICWHQGAPHPRGFPYLNVGIYLDNAGPGDGCLRYVPGTQHELQNIPDLVAEHGWDIPGVVEQPAQAGDILVQDMMVLHGSQPKRSPGVRRTIYVELRPASGILESDCQSDVWGELRRRWMGLVVRRAEPTDWPADWQGDLPSELGADEEEIARILDHWEPPIPAVYGQQTVAAPGYPIPLESSHAADQ